jgi:hypothetical protein
MTREQWLLNMYENSIVDTEDSFFGIGSVAFWKRPKKEHGEKIFNIYFKSTENIDEFVVSDKVDYFNKHEGIKIIDKAIKDTGNVFEYQDYTIETALGVVGNKHLSLVFLER